VFILKADVGKNDWLTNHQMETKQTTAPWFSSASFSSDE